MHSHASRPVASTEPLGFRLPLGKEELQMVLVAVDLRKCISADGALLTVQILEWAVPTQGEEVPLA